MTKRKLATFKRSAGVCKVRGLGVGAVLGDLEIHLQPVVEVATGVVVAAEALARFPAPWAGSPEIAFADAYARGRGVELEAVCLRAALAARDRLPGAMLLAVNVSPEALVDPLIRRCWPADLDKVIVEVTEQHSDSTIQLSEEVAQLRRRGAAIAIDDVSTGYAGLLRVASLCPDYVKIDRQIIAGVGGSIAQVMVLEALVEFSHRIGAAVIGEGVEHADELAALAKLDVDFVQGYAIARPAKRLTPVPGEVIDLCLAGRRHLLDQPASADSAAAPIRDMHSVTAALARAVEYSDLQGAIAYAAELLDMDVLRVWVIRDEEYLQQVAVSGEMLDPARYGLRDLLATRTALSTKTPIEAHLHDPYGDGAEREILVRAGHASVLLIPLCTAARPVGILELAHRTPRRWTSHDTAHSRGLAEHLGILLRRLDDTSSADASDIPRARGVIPRQTSPSHSADTDNLTGASDNNRRSAPI